MTGFDIKHFVHYWVPTLLYMGLIFYFSSQSDLGISIVPIENFDKLLHFSEYFVLCLLFYRSLVNSPTDRLSGNAVVLAIVFSLLYAVSDEFHQWFIPNREADILDIVADGAGAAVSQLMLGARKISLKSKIPRAS
ncbi:MAG: VanZ family protein [bacterium]